MTILEFFFLNYLMEEKSFLRKIDLKSPNKNIVPITTSIGSDGKLSIGGCSIEELVNKYDSPLYILDELTLRNSCRAYKKALEKYYPGESLPIYASKANSSIFMSNLVSKEGLGLDAVSEGMGLAPQPLVPSVFAHLVILFVLH